VKEYAFAAAALLGLSGFVGGQALTLLGYDWGMPVMGAGLTVTLLTMVTWVPRWW
jgi:hypothetical protein